MPKITIRKMIAADQRQWLEMRRTLWPDCPKERHSLEMDQLLRSEGIALVAMDADGRSLGFAEISIRRDHVEGTSSTPVPYLEGWYVGQGHRNRGVGRALIHAAEKWALEAGFTEMASDAEIDNDEGIRARLKLGFREVGRSMHFVRPLSALRTEVRNRTEGLRERTCALQDENHPD
jgi:aminoglycoside 6'-N-acetyltransferase I